VGLERFIGSSCSRTQWTGKALENRKAIDLGSDRVMQLWQQGQFDLAESKELDDRRPVCFIELDTVLFEEVGLELRGNHSTWTGKAEQKAVLGVHGESILCENRCFEQMTIKKGELVGLLNESDVLDKVFMRQILSVRSVLVVWTWTDKATLSIALNMVDGLLDFEGDRLGHFSGR
jgi:hypothetical protein